jgi:Zn-dependent peptidase ImmA (M78 family)
LKTLISAAEGEAALTIGQLKKLSIYFHKSMLFFINPAQVDEDKILSAQFRTINNRRPIHDRKLRAFIERVEKQRAVYLGLKDDLEVPYQANWYPDDLDLSDINKKLVAEKIREWLMLPDVRDFVTLRQIVESKEIMVIVSNGYNGDWQIKKDESVRGFSLYYDSFPVIVIKKQIEGAQAFTLFNELIHLLLHKDSVLDYEEDYESEAGREKEANLLAGYILMPDRLVDEINIRELARVRDNDIDRLLKPYADRWCVSVEAILVRLIQERKINFAFYEAYREYKADLRMQPRDEDISIPRNYRHREPLKIFGESFVTTVLEAYHNQHISLAKVSSYLDNINIKDVHKLEKHVIQF